MGTRKKTKPSSLREKVGMSVVIRRATKNLKLNPENIQKVKEISATNTRDLKNALSKLNLA